MYYEYLKRSARRVAQYLLTPLVGVLLRDALQRIALLHDETTCGKAPSESQSLFAVRTVRTYCTYESLQTERTLQQSFTRHNMGRRSRQRFLYWNFVQYLLTPLVGVLLRDALQRVALPRAEAAVARHHHTLPAQKLQ